MTTNTTCLRCDATESIGEVRSAKTGEMVQYVEWFEARGRNDGILYGFYCIDCHEWSLGG